MIDRTKLAAIADPALLRSAELEHGIAASVAYLGSDAALRSLSVDPYWPKWDSPWWHMLLLHELGEAAQIPARTVAAMVEVIEAMPLHIFPIHPGEAPPGTDLARDVLCHCAIGCMHQVLSACGVDVDRALPWFGTWLRRYQMADGGLTCDETAYLQTDECPSSMVGTVAPFEAMLIRGDDRGFLDRGARFLIERRLTQGSSTVHNAEERAVAPTWHQLCFPRFYFYDVLRGLAALVRWAEQTGAALPAEAISEVVDELVTRFPDGVVRVERRAIDGRTTLVPTVDRSPSPRVPTTTFPLLDAVSVIGAPSEALTRQWTQTRRALIRLVDQGRIV